MHQHCQEHVRGLRQQPLLPGVSNKHAVEQGNESTETKVCEQSSSLVKDEPVLLQRLSSHQHLREVQAVPINSLPRNPGGEGISLLWVWRARHCFGEIRDPAEGWAGNAAAPLLLRPPPSPPLLHLTAGGRGLRWVLAAQQPNNNLMKYLILLPVLLG